jgi:hypothetical protein
MPLSSGASLARSSRFPESAAFRLASSTVRGKLLKLTQLNEG